ncbi:M15 family metallopeptidase [Pseudoramibacter sp.]|jgi:D-alanyl-D-alanine carboxypeptidase|uniref:M15 family metallopeptidase n=1 Tax=Pseudoramibacter sp. TaxID=2034862 RepID=UPI0025FA7E9F|nr:M15 family metallopeptidase [Pseudoramibacter sp.]MCH4073165.1 M15 family metallopeptidase [Pseudoramibacter sp.]MCH4106937.1 M15 family metallopeptidase [Pseudoramibacter sp.]
MQKKDFLLKRYQWLLIGFLVLIVCLSTASFHFIKNQEQTKTNKTKKAAASSYTTLKDKAAQSGSVEQLVNKTYHLSRDYVPGDLVTLNVQSVRPVQLRKEAAAALTQMFGAAAKEGITLVANSGYRSYEDQEKIFAQHVQTMGEAKANAISSKAGESEHQLGLAVDLTCAEMSGDLQQSFENTAEGKWIAAHAQDYGYIIRFPKGAEAQTGYEYEPWHVRYVGVSLAQKIKKSGLCYEAYLKKHGADRVQ